MVVVDTFTLIRIGMTEREPRTISGTVQKTYDLYDCMHGLLVSANEYMQYTS